MSGSPKIIRESSLLVPAVEEVPRISDSERAALRTSLEKAGADIAAGRFDVLTPELLRAEFDAAVQAGALTLRKTAAAGASS
jgi:hypothetical protein